MTSSGKSAVSRPPQPHKGSSGSGGATVLHPSAPGLHGLHGTHHTMHRRGSSMQLPAAVEDGGLLNMHFVWAHGGRPAWQPTATSPARAEMTALEEWGKKEASRCDEGQSKLACSLCTRERARLAGPPSIAGINPTAF
jgi:hypothetical protein